MLMEFLRVVRVPTRTTRPMGQLVLTNTNASLRHSGMFLAGIQVFGR